MLKWLWHGFGYWQDIDRATHGTLKENMQKQIRLQNNGHSWIAWHMPPEAWEDILDLFGSLHIPTAFTSAANGEEVQRDIQRLNPDCSVILWAKGAQ